MASLAIGLALAGTTCIGLVGLAFCFPSLANVNTAAAGPGGVPPPIIFVSESAGLAGFVIAWSAYLTWMAYIWGPMMRSRRTLLSAGLVLALWVGFILVAAQLVRMSRGHLDGELLVCGLFALLGSFSVVVAAPTVHHRFSNRPSYTPDGKLDLRCPQCDYRMVGLVESRCPECGTRYTIDELLAAQDYMDRLTIVPRHADRP